jgi:hypothetical protein
MPIDEDLGAKALFREQNSESAREMIRRADIEGRRFWRKSEEQV